VRFYCFTIPGLEDVSAGEIVSRLPGARVEEKKQGIVFFAYQEDLRPLLIPAECPVLWTGMNASGDGFRKGAQPPS